MDRRTEPSVRRRNSPRPVPAGHGTAGAAIEAPPARDGTAASALRMARLAAPTSEGLIMTTKLLERPGGSISYDDTGGDGPLMIAAPGMGDTRRVYRHLSPALTAAGLRLATMDLRGMGESSMLWDDFSDAAVASDLLALIDHLGGGPAFLMGNSMSCAASVIAATEMPDRVAGLALIGPFVRDLPLPWWQRAAFRAVLARPWGRRAWVSYYRRSLYPGPRPTDLDTYAKSLLENLSEPGRFAAFRAMAFNSHAESGERVSRVTQPALVIMGTADPDFPDPTREANEVARLLNGQVLLVEGSGHYPQADQPGEVAPAVIDLVRGTAGRLSAPGEAAGEHAEG